jgi:phage protein D
MAADAPERLAPEFRVRVDDADLPPAAAADVLGVSVLQDVDAPSLFTVDLVNWDPDRNEMSWSDGDLFVEGQAVEVAIGYRDHLVTVVTGEITSVELVVRASEAPRLVVRGYDRSHRLRRGRTTRTYTDVTDADLAGRVGDLAGLDVAAEATSQRYPYVVQRDQTDLDFLRQRARAIGFEVVVDDRTLHFRARRHGGEPAATLSRDADLLEFAPRTSCAGQIGSVAVRGWDARRKTAIVGTAAAVDLPDRMDDRDSGLATAVRVFGAAEARWDGAIVDQAQADALAQARLADAALGYVRGEGTCLGRPEVRAGAVVEMVGLGRRFSGRYYVTSAIHAYGPSGYRTRFSVRRNAS